MIKCPNDNLVKGNTINSKINDKFDHKFQKTIEENLFFEGFRVYSEFHPSVNKVADERFSRYQYTRKLSKRRNRFT